MRLFGHPVHPASVHLPLGLLLAVPLWDGVAFFQGGAAWPPVAFWCLAAGLAASLPAAATGVLDFLSVDAEHPGLPDAWRHMALMGTALSLDLAALLVRGGPDPLAGTRFAAAGALSLLSALLLAVGGWFGGQMVYKHKIGVEER